MFMVKIKPESITRVYFLHTIRKTKINDNLFKTVRISSWGIFVTKLRCQKWKKTWIFFLKDNF